MWELKGHDASILALLAEQPSQPNLVQVKGRLSTRARKVAEALVSGTKTRDRQIDAAVDALKRWAKENKTPRRIA